VRKLPVASECATTDPRDSRPMTAAAAPSPASVATLAAHHPAEVNPLAPERYKIQFSVSRESYERRRRAQDLLRHSVPNRDVAAIYERAGVARSWT
jgi:hypothetical protein